MILIMTRLTIITVSHRSPGLSGTGIHGADQPTEQGRQLGISAKLASKLNYLWRSYSGELTEQNDLFRLTYALETAKDMHWNYRLLSDRE